MKPTIGRIVLYILPAAYWQYVDDADRIRPAIVTRVNADDSINVRVIYDPTDMFRVAAQEQTRVGYSSSQTVSETRPSGSWFWPPRSESGYSVHRASCPYEHGGACTCS